MPEPIAVVLCVGLALCAAFVVRSWPALILTTALIYIAARFIAVEMGFIAMVASGAYFPSEAWAFQMVGQLLVVWLLGAGVFWIAQRVRAPARG